MLQIAKVLKSNGTDGDVLLGFKTVAPEDIDTTEPVYIYVDGLPVPFFVESLTKKGNDKAVVHLTDLNNLKDAEEIIGEAVWADYFEEEEEGEDFSALKGWSLLDGKGLNVGKISDFIDIPSNPCIEVVTETGKAIVPLHEDLILEMNTQERTLKLEIPEGLLDL